VANKHTFQFVLTNAAGAEIAVDLMLQEDFSHLLCRVLSWRVCHLRLTEILATTPQEVTADEKEEAAPPADDEEEVILCTMLLRHVQSFINELV